MAIVVYNILTEYNILDKLQCITSDNASNNYRMVQELSRKLRDEAGIEWDYETNHLPCFAHIINLLVKNLLSTIRRKTSLRTCDNTEDDDFVFQDLDFDLENPSEADGVAFKDRRCRELSGVRKGGACTGRMD